MKIGLDYHGVIKTSPEFFAALTRSLLFCKGEDNEVHLITGMTRDDTNKIKAADKIGYTHFFSITDFLIEQNTLYTLDKHNRPIFEEVCWNKVKADYCEKNKIDIMIDDTECYGKYFKTPFILWKKIGGE